ncbi:hypothetical protein [Streptomyces sp. NBC_00648]|uniref:hypothetical protein n=1 Tax=Streptomyces sp. NBC_00648 TaxID=2975797 RepID=UPI00324FA151
MRDFVAARRKKVAAQAGAPVEAFVTRHNALGADAEVDFGDVYVDIAGQRTPCYATGPGSAWIRALPNSSGDRI